MDFIEQYEERNPVAGLGEQDSVAMTVRLTLIAGARKTTTDTFHAYNEGVGGM